jgi:hypothetical protein
MEERKGAIVHSTEEDALWEDSDIELSADDLGHPEPRDRRYTILVDNIVLFSV